MKLLPDGPDIPKELLTAQEKGKVLFICGAGVSMTVGLPSFKGLVEAVYTALGENWRLHPAEREVMEPNGRLSGQYDRALRSLERRLTASSMNQAGRLRERLRSAVRAELQPPATHCTDLGVHTALLELSRDAESNIRLVTTNFDTLFERAWPRMSECPSFAGPAMPQPKTSGCAGVLHIHGRLKDEFLGLPETELVLTSAEFGDAYLRSGWASRYVYDLVRAYTVVLVGYKADDPPMRYLLEVLESDRQRYTDLQKVYAFTAADGDAVLTEALWEGKGVVPILHNVDGDDYGPLYRTIIEWHTYAEDPTTWRREQLRRLFDADPAASPATVERVTELLRHGDASLLLSTLNPQPAWLPLLRQQRLFDDGASSPGAWIAVRLDDPDMIRAVAAHPEFDDISISHIENALDQKRAELSQVRARSWDIILSANKLHISNDDLYSWYKISPRIRAGETGYHARHIVANLLRPRLTVSQTYRWHDEQGGRQADHPTNENISSLMCLEFKAPDHVNTSEIFDAWPRETNSILRLLQTLERTLLDALEHEEDFKFIVRHDRSDHDIPSISPHAQNSYHAGFYPIVRAIADFWELLAELAPDQALTFSRSWGQSNFLIYRRLAIYAATNSISAATDLANIILNLDDYDFWLSGAQVELMHGLLLRWDELIPQVRADIETRLSRGIPRTLFGTDEFEENDWISVLDRSVYRRLTRLEASGKRLGVESIALIKEIGERHAKWRPSEDDRDDFHSWSESRSGLDGDVGLLKDVPDAILVEEALKIQIEHQFYQSNLWQKFCQADPVRAFRGLRSQADSGIWNIYAWRLLFSAADESFYDDLMMAIADAVLSMPPRPTAELALTVADWIRKHRTFLHSHQIDGVSRLWLLWDRLAQFVYADDSIADLRGEDLGGRALNRPGGMLAWTLIDHLGAAKLSPGVGLGELEPRFNLVAGSDSESGLLGRVHFARALGHLFQTAPEWTATEMLPRFQADHAEALAMWGANSLGNVDSARLFNLLKIPLLEIITRPALSDSETSNLATRLFNILISHQENSPRDYNLLPNEVRDFLSISSERIREHFSWLLWRLQSKKTSVNGDPIDKGARWKELVCPIFTQIWPLDVTIRSKRASANLVQMTMNTGEAFPEAVDIVSDFLLPYEIYMLEYIFRREPTHATLTERYPKAAVRLMNALIDPAICPIPRDLGRLLDNCQQRDPLIVQDSAFLRLGGFRRLSGA